MSQEIEIEYKVVVTKEDFEKLAASMPFPNEAFTQKNHYFETKAFALKSQRCALRIREKDGTYTLTLKEPHIDGILETHDILSEKQFVNWINGTPNVMSNVSNQLKKLRIDEDDLIYFGYLSTERRTFIQDDMEYVLDKSSYNGNIDYEFELETNSAEKGLIAFQQIIETYNIPRQKPITKVERFFLSLKK